jgi:para-nitrobenzyl esterase
MLREAVVRRNRCGVVSATPSTECLAPKPLFVLRQVGLSLAVMSGIALCGSPARASVERGSGSAGGSRVVVRTADGVMRGSEQSEHRLFAGIPYASPPARWKPPQPVTPWRGIRDATRPGSECVQSAAFWRPGSPTSWNEDCLYLNVWTPRHVDRPLPVVVFFHGGGWVNGAATDVQPSRLTEWGDSIVVTVNYRLGALGYLALPELDAESADRASSGNYGDLDKIQSLRWARRNIAAFGGDPSRVTIAGQSAGAGSVCWLLASPTARGLFARAVIQSIGDCAAAGHDDALGTGTFFAQAIGCPDAATMLGCLRAKTPAQLLQAQGDTGVGWNPVVGGASQPLFPLQAFASGSFNRVPVIIGNTRHEARAFVYENNDLAGRPLSAEAYEQTIEWDFGDAADRVLAEYPVTAYAAPGLARAAVDTDAFFACNSVPITDALSAWVPTFAYEFRDETAPARPYMVVAPSFPIGSAHSSDAPYVWQIETSVPLTPAQLRLSKLMIGYWSRFARDGTPNARHPNWPRYDASRGLRVGFLPAGQTELVTRTAYGDDHHCAFWQQLFA